jgi:hypothetical protein
LWDELKAALEESRARAVEASQPGAGPEQHEAYEEASARAAAALADLLKTVDAATD